MRRTRNKFETETFKVLKKKKIKVVYEGVKIPYVIQGNYNPDFICTGKLGHVMYIETKGHFRPEAKRKMAAVKKLHPHLDIRIVFYKRKLVDIRWAERHGFPWAISTIPDEWVEELNARLPQT